MTATVTSTSAQPALAGITFPDGWGPLRASNTQPILVLRFEARDPTALDAARSEVVGWLAGQGVRA